MLAAILTICGLTIVLPCHSNSNGDSKVLTTEDTSQFVTLTDVIPDAILEIRYFSTYNFVGTRPEYQKWESDKSLKKLSNPSPKVIFYINRILSANKSLYLHRKLVNWDYYDNNRTKNINCS